MTNLIVFLVGGSARVCKILTHLIGAKTLRDVRKVTFIFVDSDMANGDGQEVVNIIRTFEENIGALGFPEGFTVDVKKWDYAETLDALLYKLNPNAAITLENQFSRQIGDQLSREEKIHNLILLRSQFSQEQMDCDTQDGLFGLNNVGATLVKSLQANDRYRDYDNNNYSPVSYLKEIITEAVYDYKIFVIGSVFGGTGSTLVMNLSKEISEFVNGVIKANNTYAGKIKIGGTFMLPYFRYEREEESRSPNPDEFYGAAYYTMLNIKSLAGGDYRNLHRSRDGGLFDQLYLVGNEDMEKIEYKNFDSSLSNNKSRILDGLIDPEMGQYEPGSGGEVISNTSFESASSLTLGTEKHLYLGPGITRYYKYTPTTLNYLSIYSSGTLDSIITIYDETYNVILSNDTVYGHGLGYTTSPNFFCNFYAEKNKTYFFEVELFSSTDSGYIDMLLFVDNWSYSNYSDLVINVDDVDNKRKVEYKNNSKYSSEIDYAISEWNKLESILITPDTSSTLNNVVINDYYDASGSYILGYTVHNWIFSATIYLNTYYLDTVSEAERIHTILHEFGHVLGLGEFTNYESSNNVMHQGCLSLTHLGPADIGAYRYLWG